MIASKRTTLRVGTVILTGICVYSLVVRPDAVLGQKKKDEFGPGYDIIANSQGVEQINFINEALAKAWEANKITPSERCTDFEFIRRASLDIIGRIAKVEEIRQYLNDPPRERRSKLVERLLATEEYAQNWANNWTILLLTRSGSKKYHQDLFRNWLAGKLKEDPSKSYIPDWSKIVTEMLTATGTTDENPAVNYILHHMGDQINKDREENGTFDMVPITSRTTKTFLGLRTQCVQCHDHPFSGEWGQHHFWGINAFFRQTDAPQGRPTIDPKKKKDMGNRDFTLVDNPGQNAKGLVFYERRNALLLPTNSTFLTGKKISSKHTGSRRAALAKFITTSPFFGKVNVNRMWAHFFGISMTKDQPDDFGEHNPIAHPELLTKLAKDWTEKYDHNPKDLIRWICNSYAYGLSSIANKTNDSRDLEVFFSRMLLKSMSPEQLFESLMVATDARVAQSREEKLKLRQQWLDKLVVNFGDDEGNESSYNGTVIQALMLMNGQDINDAIMDEKTGTVATILKRRASSRLGAKEAIADIYLAGLNRLPTSAEYNRILSPQTYMFKANVQRQQKDAQKFWKGYYQDIMWAVVNSNEFFLNH